MAYDDTLQAHIDACLDAGEGKFSLVHDDGWAASIGKAKATGETAIAAVAALLTAIRETKTSA